MTKESRIASSLCAIPVLSFTLLLTACGSGGGSAAPQTPAITSIAVVCSPASILTTQTSTCTATAQGTGSYSSAVTWAASDGTITSSGVFTPAAAGTAIVTATSTEDSTKSGTASIVVGSQTTNGEWAWMGGSDTASASGIYGSLGVAAPSNVPGARFSAVSWKDTNGNFWLFGGLGVDSSGAQGLLNDLWEFNSTSNKWTWISGSNTVNALGIYGTEGVPAAANVPGSRYCAVGWTDSSGNLWLFGGEETDSAGNGVPFNDLWEFNLTTKEWTWVGGSSIEGSYGVYGTRGVASASNVPMSRYQAVSWTDNDGNFWLFGGINAYGYIINDLMEYDPTAKTWTWWGGSPTGETKGSYGTRGVSSSSNFPGSRDSAIGWTDSGGNLWLFGGYGADSNDMWGDLNDLWEFNTSTEEWTWEGGSSTTGAIGVYGALGVAAAANVPGARYSTVGWTDSNGNLWLLGGSGYDSTGSSGAGDLNDLWEFTPATKEWKWVSGSDTRGASSVFGSLGVADASNTPGDRYGSLGWTDSSGNLWLFGGADKSGAYINDLWRYQP